MNTSASKMLFYALVLGSATLAAPWTQATTSTINTSRSNIKNNSIVSPPIKGNDGPVTSTTNLSDTTTISESPFSIKGNFSTGDVGNLNDIRLSSTTSGNTISSTGQPCADSALAAIAPGNSIAGGAFSGAAGVTVNNMNNGANSTIQSVVGVSAARAISTKGISGN